MIPLLLAVTPFIPLIQKVADGAYKKTKSTGITEITQASYAGAIALVISDLKSESCTQLGFDALWSCVSPEHLGGLVAMILVAAANGLRKSREAEKVG
jgi:hypothetical protein